MKSTFYGILSVVYLLVFNRLSSAFKTNYTKKEIERVFAINDKCEEKFKTNHVPLLSSKVNSGISYYCCKDIYMNYCFEEACGINMDCSTFLKPIFNMRCNMLVNHPDYCNISLNSYGLKVLEYSKCYLEAGIYFRDYYEHSRGERYRSDDPEQFCCFEKTVRKCYEKKAKPICRSIDSNFLPTIIKDEYCDFDSIGIQTTNDNGVGGDANIGFNTTMTTKTAKTSKTAKTTKTSKTIKTIKTSRTRTTPGITIENTTIESFNCTKFSVKEVCKGFVPDELSKHVQQSGCIYYFVGLHVVIFYTYYMVCYRHTIPYKKDPRRYGLKLHPAKKQSSVNVSSIFSSGALKSSHGSQLKAKHVIVKKPKK